jgi:hypothetical protein
MIDTTGRNNIISTYVIEPDSESGRRVSVTIEYNLDYAIEEFAGNMLDNQQPLGSEFAKVLHDNLWDLYEE